MVESLEQLGGALSLATFAALQSNSLRFEISNFAFVLQRQRDVIEPFQETLSAKVIDREVCFESSPIGNRKLLKVDR